MTKLYKHEKVTELRVVCNLKLSSSNLDCSIVSLSFFLPLILILLLLLFPTPALPSSWLIFEPEPMLKLWSIGPVSSSLGHKVNDKSKKALAAERLLLLLSLGLSCLPAACSPTPSPRQSPVLHSSAAAMVCFSKRESDMDIIESCRDEESWVGGFYNATVMKGYWLFFLFFILVSISY